MTFSSTVVVTLHMKDITTMLNNTLNANSNSTSLINPVLIEKELRILDIDLAQRLGFERPRDIRKLINRYSDELDEMGVRATVAQTPSAAGGRPAMAFYLNRKQAIFITTKSETKDAINVTIEIIKKFEAYERGEITSFQIPQSYSEALRLAADQAEQIKELKPKADGFDRIAAADGSLCITDAAKNLQMGPKELFFYLNSHEWIYRRTGNKNWLAYQDKIKQGLLEHKVTEVSLSDGTGRISEQVRITPKGLTRLSEMFSNHV